jgi:hypothetical protein
MKDRCKYDTLSKSNSIVFERSTEILRLIWPRSYAICIIDAVVAELYWFLLGERLKRRHAV